MLYPALRPLLFALDPENAHELTLAALKRTHGIGLFGCPAARAGESPVRVMGLEFPNRVGLAAGLDKNGECIDAFAAMGFGFIEVGTVTPRPQPGNPRPRMFRLPERSAIINRMGFNNLGVDHLLENVRQSRFRGVLGINIGKNADTPIERAADDYLIGLRKAYAAASYITINISSPNTKNLRALQGSDELSALLGALKAAQQALSDTHGRYVPLAVKIAPDLDDAQIQAIADVVRAQRMDGVIATNTTLSREAVAGLRHADEAGGLSGAPLLAASTEVLRKLAAALAGEVPIIGVGGIMNAANARAKIEAGAALVQLYSGLIYNGPDLVRDCVAALRQPARQAAPG